MKVPVAYTIFNKYGVKWLTIFTFPFTCTCVSCCAHQINAILHLAMEGIRHGPQLNPGIAFIAKIRIINVVLEWNH
jgi:hypothetical protein